MIAVDISCDLGEAQNPAEQDIEDQIWPLITSANVACGGHAGNRESMIHAVSRARKHSVLMGAHPSYPDRANFGRRSMTIDPSQLRSSLAGQITQLAELAREASVRMDHVKPHGALYNDAHHDATLASIIIQAVSDVNSSLAIVASSRSALYAEASRAGLTVIPEAFGDRRYRPDGSLTSRNEPGALLLDSDVATKQVLLLAERGEVLTAGDIPVAIPFRTICVHADMPGSVDRLMAIRKSLIAMGVALTAAQRVG